MRAVMPTAPIASRPRPSSRQFRPFPPKELDEDGIEKQIADIVTAAARAREAGYDGVEIMGSEGYFLNQFIVKHTNKRTDRWGGSYENRIRLPVEVVRRVREAVGPDFIVIYRLSMIDLVPEGSTFDEVVQLAQAVEAAGATIINTGIGWHEARIPTIATSVPRRGFAWVTGKLMGKVGIPVITSNRINTPDVAEERAGDGCADMVSMARPFLADAHFVAKAAEGRADEIAPCIACNQACLDHTFSGKLTSCLVNPRACHETECATSRPRRPNASPSSGRGRRDDDAAIVAAERGHRVTLFEKAGRVGGQLNMAREIPGKEEFHGLVDWFARMLDRIGVEVRLGAGVTPDRSPFRRGGDRHRRSPARSGHPGAGRAERAQLHRRAGGQGGGGRDGRHHRRRRDRLRRGRIPCACGRKPDREPCPLAA